MATNRNKERNQSISQLKQVLSYFSNKEFQIKNSIENESRKTKVEFDKFLTNFTADCLSNVSCVSSSFQVPDSFFEHLSHVKPKLEQLIEQKSRIEQLIQNISPSVSTALSEFEQRIILILSAKSFLDSPAVASVQEMINICSNMRRCLNILVIYSQEIKTNTKCKFEIDRDALLSYSNSLEQVSQVLADFKQKIDKTKQFFYEKYSVDSLFSESADFSSFVESISSLQAEIETIKIRFSTTKNILDNFVWHELDLRKDFVHQDYRDACEEHVGSSGEHSDYYDFNRHYTEPAKATRENLEAMLRSIS